MLIDYAAGITSYDLAVMFVQGYIDQTEDSNTFATLSADPKLFDAGDSLPSKVSTIKTLVRELLISLNKSKCNDLLQQFHTAKGLEQSIQLSIEEIGDAVQTGIKLLLSEIALKYDGFDKISAGPFAKEGEVDKDIEEGLYTDITFSDGMFGSPSNGLLPEGVYRFRTTVGDEEMYLSALGSVSHLLMCMS